MGKLSDKAKKIDIYASLPSFSFGKDGKVYSRLGLLFTFLTVIIIGGMAIWIGIKIFGRQTPSFIQYSLPAPGNSPRLKWEPADFRFGTTLQGREDYPLVSVTAQYTQGYSTIPVTVGWCSMDTFSGQRFSCPPPNEGFSDYTYLDTEGSYSFQMDYDYCVNTGATCYDEDRAKQELNDDKTRFIFVYEDLLIDPFNYETPVSTTLTSLNDILLLDIGRTLVITFNEVEFISDNGWIFQDLKTETKLKATTSMKVSDAKILRIQFAYGGTKTVYKRTYPKIQDFLAQVSGFITILTPIFLILVAPYTNLQAIQHMVNEIYEIKLNKPENNGGNSLQRSSSSKRKRQSSKSQASPTSPKGTEDDLLPQKDKPKAKVKSKTSPPASRNSFPFAPHAALVIGGVGKSLTREDTPPIPEENTSPFRFETLEKSPSSPFKSSSMNDGSPQKTLLEHAKTTASEEQKPENGKLNENLEPIKAKEEAEEPSSVEESESEEEAAEKIPLRASDSLEVPWQDWLKSFWKPSPQVQVLHKAKEHIMEAFDLVTLAKKVVEIDKLKACLFTHDQRVIFENLPSSVIVLNPDIDLKSPEAVKQYHWKDTFKGDEIAVKKAYFRLKETKSELDQLLIRLYEDEFIDDGASL